MNIIIIILLKLIIALGIIYFLNILEELLIV